VVETFSIHNCKAAKVSAAILELDTPLLALVITSGFVGDFFMQRETRLQAMSPSAIAVEYKWGLGQVLAMALLVVPLYNWCGYHPLSAQTSQLRICLTLLKQH